MGVHRDDAMAIDAAIAAGADMNARGSGGQTPLMMASLQGKVKALKALLNQGADANIGEADGYTPMHGAAFQGRAEAAQVLIAHGINARDMHEDGFEPIQRACWGTEKRHTDTVSSFLRHGVPLDGKVFETCRESRNAGTREAVKQWWIQENSGIKSSL